MSYDLSLRWRTAVRAAAYLALMGAASHALADGQPLILDTQSGIHDGQGGTVLDTQTGIHDGRSGLVLQNAPLSRAPMVPAQQLPTLQQSGAADAQPQIVVAPYIALPGANGAAPAAGSGYRMSPGTRQ